MTKKYLAVTAFFLLILALSYGIYRRLRLTSPQPKPPTLSSENQLLPAFEKWKTYKEGVYGFTISYPSNWILRHYESNRRYDPYYGYIDHYPFYNDKDPGFAFRLSLEVFEFKNIEELFIWSEKNYHYRCLKYPVIPESENAVIAGVPAYIFVSPRDDYGPESYAAVWEHLGYLFMLSGPLPETEFIRVLKSLTFTGVEPKFHLPEFSKLPRDKIDSITELLTSLKQETGINFLDVWPTEFYWCGANHPNDDMGRPVCLYQIEGKAISISCLPNDELKKVEYYFQGEGFTRVASFGGAAIGGTIEYEKEPFSCEINTYYCEDGEFSQKEAQERSDVRVNCGESSKKKQFFRQ